MIIWTQCMCLYFLKWTALWRLHWYPSSLNISWEENKHKPSSEIRLAFLVINYCGLFDDSRSHQVFDFTNMEREQEAEARRRKETPLQINPVRVWFVSPHLTTDRKRKLLGKLVSRRRGWRRTAGGCGWSRLWPRRQSRFLVTSLWRSWSGTGICWEVNRRLVRVLHL